MSAGISFEMAGMKEAAKGHGFAVPQCAACGHCSYPPQSSCPECLAPETNYIPDGGNGSILSTTRVHRSVDGVRGLPLCVACVRTASGVSLFALAAADLPAGSPVKVRVHDDLFQVHLAN